jgi:Na+/H+ antiporter NhaD/arsenite permease-like protein
MIAIAIFVITYAVLAAGRVPFLRLDRTGAAMVGGLAMVLSGALDLEAAAATVDVATIVLLFGMMVIVAHLRLAGAFVALARLVAARVTDPAALLVALVFASGLLSALFVNDTICLVFTPVVLEVASLRGHRPLPYLLALATASNIGSVATITGNPQNMLIESMSGLSFTAFSTALLPVALVGLALDAAILWVMFRHELHRLPTDQATPRAVRLHTGLLIKTLVVVIGVLAGFLLGYPTALVAMAGAAALLLTRRVRPEKVYRAVDWDLLLLFIGLFVLVGGAERSGLAAWLFDTLRPLGVHTVAGLTLGAAALSNAISNVPAVMLFTRIAPLTPDPDAAWLTLAMASTLAGNLTILGSIANLIVVEGARRQGVAISFTDYARVGVPVTLTTLAFGAWWLS